MDDQIFFEALDKFPATIEKVDKLAEAVMLNNKVTTDNVAAVSRAVAEQGNKLSTMESALQALDESINSASSRMQGEVNIKYPPMPEVKIKHSDITVNAVHTEEEIDRVAEIVAEKVKNKKASPDFYMIASLIIVVICIAIIGLWAINQNNDYRSWMARAISIGITAGDMHPGDRGIVVKEEFERGGRARKAIKAEIRKLESKYDMTWQNNAKILQNIISDVAQTDVVILDYSLADVDSSSFNALVKFREKKSENEIRAHIRKDGNIYLTTDNDINTVQDANKYSRRSSWHYYGKWFPKENHKN